MHIPFSPRHASPCCCTRSTQCEETKPLFCEITQVRTLGHRSQSPWKHSGSRFPAARHTMGNALLKEEIQGKKKKKTTGSCDGYNRREKNLLAYQVTSAGIKMKQNEIKFSSDQTPRKLGANSFSYAWQTPLGVSRPASGLEGQKLSLILSTRTPSRANLSPAPSLQITRPPQGCFRKLSTSCSAL